MIRGYRRCRGLRVNQSSDWSNRTDIWNFAGAKSNEVSRWIEMREPVVGDNERSSIESVGPEILTEGIESEALFLRYFPAIRDDVQGRTQKGVAIFGLDGGTKPFSRSWLCADRETPRAMILGRHTSCDLVVPSRYKEVALRHAAILAEAQGEGVSVRVIDLKTQLGIFDESNRILDAVMLDGPSFLRIGSIIFFFWPTGAGFSIKEDAAATYKCLPPRIFAEETVRKLSDGSEAHRDSTLVRSLLPPASPDEIATGNIEAHIVLCTQKSAVQCAVSTSLLDRGLLIGRYQRCFGGHGLPDTERVSRVHLLIVRHGDGVLALDTGSSNGTHHEGQKFKLGPLKDGLRLDLAHQIDFIWRTEANPDIPLSNTLIVGGSSRNPHHETQF